MKERLPLVLSVTAIVLAVLAATPLGQAAQSIVPSARFAQNAGKVDGINASRTPRAGYLLALGKGKKFPASVIGEVQGPVGPRGEKGDKGDKGDTGSAGPPGVSNLERVVVQGIQSTTSPKSLTATCPAGKRAIGGGAEAEPVSSADELALESSYATGSPPTGWLAKAHEITATTGNWRLIIVVICATVAG